MLIVPKRGRFFLLQPKRGFTVFLFLYQSVYLFIIMASIIDKNIWFNRNSKDSSSQDPNSSPELSDDDSSDIKIISSVESSPGQIKHYNIWDSNISNGPNNSVNFAIGADTERAWTSQLNDQIYTGSYFISGVRHSGFINTFNNVDDAIAGRLNRSVDLALGPFRHGLSINCGHMEKLVVSLESGAVCMLDSNLNPIRKLQATEYGHSNDMVLNGDGTKLVLANEDRSISFIDVNQLTLERRLHCAMGYPVSGADFVNKDEYVFMTCCRARNEDFNFIIRWDTRIPQAGVVFSSLIHPASAIKWSERSPNVFSVVTTNGYLYMFDARYPHTETQFIKISHDKELYRLKSIRNGKQLVSLCETNKIVLIDEVTGEFKIVEPTLPEEKCIRDLVELDSKYYFVTAKSHLLHPIDLPV